MRPTITLGRGVRSPVGVSVDIGNPKVEELARRIESHQGVEAWWAGGAFRNNRRSHESFERLFAIGVDVDYHDEHGKHVEVDPEIVLTLGQAALDQDLPGNLYHSTPRGARFVFVLESPSLDFEEARKAMRGAGALVERSLEQLGLAGRMAVDFPTLEPSRLLFTPRATVGGAERSAKVMVQSLDRFPIDDLLALSPAETDPVTLPEGLAPSPEPAASAPPAVATPPKLHSLSAEDVAAIRAALALIPPDLGYQEWCIGVGMPLHDAFRGDEDGFQLWDEWSARAGKPTYPGTAQLRAKWRSFSAQHRNPKGLATFWALAQQHGWVAPALAPAAPVTNGVGPGSVAAPVQVSTLPLPGPAKNEDGTEIRPWSESPPRLIEEVEPPRLDVSQCFPAELHWLRSICEQARDLLNVDEGFPALMAVAIASGTMGRLFQVRVGDTDWTEPMNLWAIGAVRSGGGKSPVMRLFRKALNEFAEQEEAAQSRAYGRWLARCKAIGGRKLSVERKLAKAKAGEEAMHLQELDRLADLEASMQDERPPNRVITASSLTTAALIEFLMTHQERCLIIDTEGDVFQHALGGRTEMERNVGPWMQAYSGEPIQQDRVGDGRTGPRRRRVSRPSLAIALTTQVDRLDVLGDPYAVSKGFSYRFLVGVFESRAPTQMLRAGKVSPDLLDRWAQRVHWLLSQDVPDQEVDILLDQDGAALFFDWGEQALRQTRERESSGRGSEGDPLDFRAEMSAKIRSNLARVIGVLHVLIDPPTAASRPVSAETVRCAVEHWAPWITASARASYEATNANPDLKLAERILGFIHRAGAAEFTRSEALRNLKQHGVAEHGAALRRVDDLNPALSLLTEMGWIQCAEKPTHRPGGHRVAARYLTHPRALEDPPAWR